MSPISCYKIQQVKLYDLGMVNYSPDFRSFLFSFSCEINTCKNKNNRLFIQNR